ncbi:ethylene receptor 2 [Elaeis guineensis]|uniref:Ethylene receptor n=1 Tax=Elaeis guineensis var. tenera TaxID=51953 RepID=A0A6I9R4W5_ELAGV|nr:ethylene receptor 2 [Elaeis guineensis]
MRSSWSFALCGGCEEDPTSLWTLENILQCQKVSDFLIALAYFSIPLELFYFVTCSAIFPFRWLILQFGAFIVLCGLSHLVAALAYAPHSFLLLLSLVVLKLLTALVSLATAVTLLPIIPQLLRLFVRDGLLRQKARDLGHDLGRMRRQEAAICRVRLLTAEIRRSLDRRTILDTALVHLADALSLHDCAIWMPTSPDSLSLTHHLNRRRRDHHHQTVSIPTADSDVAEIITRKAVLILDPNSNLVQATESEPVGPVAAIRMPLLRVSKFNEGMPELVEESYAILVLVLPTGGDRVWTTDEVDIVEVVADQVAVALSHAAVLEESLLMREKLMEQNMALDRAHREALMAKEARKSLQSVMTREIVGPIRLMVALLSPLQLENLNTEQLAMVKAGLALSSLIKEAADVTTFDKGAVELTFRPFHIPSVVEKIVSVSRFLCACRGVSFEFHVSGGIPGPVLGDERRILLVLLYMIENILGTGDQGAVSLQVCIEDATDDGSSDSKYVVGKQNVGQGMVTLKFEVCRTSFGKEDKISDLKESKDAVGDREISFSFCRKLAELMHWRISVSSTAASLQKNMKLLIRLQHLQSGKGFVWPRYMDIEATSCPFKGMKILLVDNDCYNVYLTKKLLGRFGCHLSIVSSRSHCLEMLYLKRNQFHLLLIDLQIFEEDRHELSAHIKNICTENRPLIVALTPDTHKNTREQCLQDGMHGVMCKPVILQEMVDELQRITQGTQSSLPL